MKHSLIEAGGVYRLQQGRDHNLDYLYTAHRCIVLDAEKKWFNSGQGYLWLPGGFEWEPAYWRVTTHGGRWRETAPRIATAVEFTQSYNTTTDPETGQPWDPEDPDVEADYGRHPVKKITLPSLWVPYAALTREIIEPWEITAERLAIQAQQYRSARRLRKDQELRRLIQQEHQQIQREKDMKVIARTKGRLDEEWEKRLQPVLIEAGINVRFESGGTTDPDSEGWGRAQFNMEDLRYLATLLEGKET